MLIRYITLVPIPTKYFSFSEIEAELADLAIFLNCLIFLISLPAKIKKLLDVLKFKILVHFEIP